MKLIFALLVLTLACVMAVPQGGKTASGEVGSKTASGEVGGKRASKDCKRSCFAHCLEGTTSTVKDFCNLTDGEQKSVQSCPSDLERISKCKTQCYCTCSICKKPA